jgi:hypothetical protein
LTLLPNVGSVLLMFKVDGSLKLLSKAVAAVLNAAASRVPLLRADATAALSASVVNGVSMLLTEVPLAVTSARKPLPAGKLVDALVVSSM